MTTATDPRLATLATWSLTFVVPGPPQPKQRHRHARVKVKVRGLTRTILRTYTPKATERYESLVGWHAKQAMGDAPPTRKPLIASIDIALPIAPSWSKTKRQHAESNWIVPTAKPDLSNVVKALEDGMNGVAYVDDSQIVELHVVKRFSAEPCVRVTLTEHPSPGAGEPIQKNRARNGTE